MSMVMFTQERVQKGGEHSCLSRQKGRNVHQRINLGEHHSKTILEYLLNKPGIMFCNYGSFTQKEFLEIMKSAE